MPDTPADGAPVVLPVIMSGGAGTRLWPISTDQRPKQFHAFASDRTLLQETVARVSGEGPVRFLPPVVIGNAGHREAVLRQLAEIGVAPSAILLEPVARNTAAVAAVAAELARNLHPGALVLLLPADHVIADAEGFRAAVGRGARVARDRIVTFGIEPTAPETGYGYIQRGKSLADGVYAVARFAEKPSRETAAAYLAEGGYDWNGGIFLFSPEVMLGELRAHRPDILEAAVAALRACEPDADGVRVLDPERFAACPSESVDIAVMEPTRLAAVAPCSVGWADVGSWSELWRLGPHDAQGNVVRGSAVAEDTRGALVWGEGVTVAVLGMTDVVVVASGEAVIVAPKSRAQDIKGLVAEGKRLIAACGGTSA